MTNRIEGDLQGTSIASFLLDAISATAVRLKAVSGVFRVRNKADSADAALVASKVSASGEAIGLNEDAAGSGADWTYDIERPTSGQSEARRVIMPAENPSVGQGMTVLSYSSGVVTLGFTTIAGGADKAVYDTTTLSFGDSSPLSMFTLPANAVALTIRVIVDTAFDGTAPTLSIGVSGTTSKFMPATAIDLKTAATYEYDASDVATSGSTQAVIATYSADSSAAGSARIIFGYVIPS